MTHPAKMTPLEEGVEDSINWCIVRAPIFGAVNGYAQIPEDHPWRDLKFQVDSYDSEPEVHGGITYGPDTDGWVGFDFAHAGDYWPEMAQFHSRYPGDVLRTQAEVAEEARNLARQIAASRQAAA